MNQDAIDCVHAAVCAMLTSDRFRAELVAKIQAVVPLEQANNSARLPCLCNTCRKSNVCNPRINYHVSAFLCGKYAKRKGTAA